MPYFSNFVFAYVDKIPKLLEMKNDMINFSHDYFIQYKLSTQLLFLLRQAFNFNLTKDECVLKCRYKPLGGEFEPSLKKTNF